MAGFWNLSRVQQQDQNGKPLIGARAYFFQAASTTEMQVYQDAGLALPHPHPLASDGYGRFPGVFFDEEDEFYKVRMEDANGVLIFEDDAIPIIGPTPPEEGDPPPVPVDPNAVYGTGDVKVRYGTGARPGWVRLNARTIGSAVSGATERANADTEALFKYLWATSTNAILPVSGGRGGSASDDWASNKTITLPDMRGRTFVGLDTMGNSAAARLTGATTLNASGGAQTVTLATTQVPGHTHTGTTAAGGNHGHPFRASTATPDTPSGSGGMLLNTGEATTYPAFTGTVSDTLGEQIGASGTHTHTFTTASTGGGQAHSNMPPYAAYTFYIKL